MWGHAECTQMLIEAGSDLTPRDEAYHKTSLMWAAVNGHVECTRLLIAAGSDLTAKDKNGRTAKDLAKEAHLPSHIKRTEGHTAVVALLRRVMHED